MSLVYTSFDYPCRTHQYGIWQSNDVYFVVIYYAIPAYYPELELQIVFLSGFNANHLYKAKVPQGMDYTPMPCGFSVLTNVLFQGMVTHGSADEYCR